LYLIIEECEERFASEDVEDILRVVTSALPRDDDDEDEEAGDNMEEGEDEMDVDNN
ncbi:hypothetical protein LPJ71_007698, partial [Coemansia sp. S17]